MLRKHFCFEVELVNRCAPDLRARSCYETDAERTANCCRLPPRSRLSGSSNKAVVQRSRCFLDRSALTIGRGRHEGQLIGGARPILLPTQIVLPDRDIVLCPANAASGDCNGYWKIARSDEAIQRHAAHVREERDVLDRQHLAWGEWAAKSRRRGLGEIEAVLHFAHFHARNCALRS
jgi:hypothetical protein